MKGRHIMKEKKQLYWVKIALFGNIYDTVTVQAENLENLSKNHKILSYKPVKNKK